jgi:putative flippase GtrA
VWLTRLYRRFQHLVHELGKFGIVGGFAYLLDSLILVILTERGWDAMAAKTISTAIAASVAFVGNRFWTWRHRVRSGLAREYSIYFVFNALGLGIALACIYVNNALLGAVWPEIFLTSAAVWVAANVVGLALGTALRFWSYRRFVFRAVVPVALRPATSSQDS